MSALQDIYNGKYTSGKAAEKLPFSLRLKLRSFLDPIEETMGPEFIERHRDDLCQIEQYRAYANFREGFRLGVSLMLEML